MKQKKGQKHSLWQWFFKSSLLDLAENFHSEKFDGAEFNFCWLVSRLEPIEEYGFSLDRLHIPPSVCLCIPPYLEIRASYFLNFYPKTPLSAEKWPSEPISSKPHIWFWWFLQMLGVIAQGDRGDLGPKIHVESIWKRISIQSQRFLQNSIHSSRYSRLSTAGMEETAPFPCIFQSSKWVKILNVFTQNGF